MSTMRSMVLNLMKNHQNCRRAKRYLGASWPRLVQATSEGISSIDMKAKSRGAGGAPLVRGTDEGQGMSTGSEIQRPGKIPVQTASADGDIFTSTTSDMEERGIDICADADESR